VSSSRNPAGLFRTRCKRHMKSHRLSLDPAYIRWRAEFEPFEARCFAAVCEFVRVHFDDLLDRYYWEGHGSLNGFPAWVFERYLVGRESG
jgi:hypothetical protein